MRKSIFSCSALSSSPSVYFRIDPPEEEDIVCSPRGCIISCILKKTNAQQIALRLVWQIPDASPIIAKHQTLHPLLIVKNKKTHPVPNVDSAECRVLITIINCVCGSRYFSCSALSSPSVYFRIDPPEEEDIVCSPRGCIISCILWGVVAIWERRAISPAQ
ncbi:hypothetical protein CEXT_326141 [Caerostris extrusa]|uniref:Uncharacterized protein n=1 Tax=Caerostris extrusa TaxID=172846 RepID=A0AAV4PEJ4_CAEEX|nr:hypothetical protein CEXT_326141 [Caerostris extrusa]